MISTYRGGVGVETNPNLASAAGGDVERSRRTQSHAKMRKVDKRSISRRSPPSSFESSSSASPSSSVS